MKDSDKEEIRKIVSEELDKRFPLFNQPYQPLENHIYGECPPRVGTCPFTHMHIPAGTAQYCNACGRTISSTSPTC